MYALNNKIGIGSASPVLRCVESDSGGYSQGQDVSQCQYTHNHNTGLQDIRMCFYVAQARKNRKEGLTKTHACNADKSVRRYDANEIILVQSYAIVEVSNVFLLVCVFYTLEG